MFETITWSSASIFLLHTSTAAGSPSFFTCLIHLHCVVAEFGISPAVCRENPPVSKLNREKTQQQDQWMFSSTHFDIRLSLQSFQVYKKPSNWNGEQFNAEQRKTYSLKIWFQKETVGRPSQILWDTPTWQFCSPQAIAYQNQFFETKNRIHMNPYISAKRRWPGDFFNFGCHIPSSSRVRPWPTSTLGTSSWRGTIDHPQCGTQVTTAFGQDLGVALVTTNGETGWRGFFFWHAWDLVYNFVFQTWIIWWKWCQQWVMRISNLLML